MFSEKTIINSVHSSTYLNRQRLIIHTNPVATNCYDIDIYYIFTIYISWYYHIFACRIQKTYCDDCQDGLGYRSVFMGSLASFMLEGMQQVVRFEI